MRRRLKPSTRQRSSGEPDVGCANISRRLVGMGPCVFWCGRGEARHCPECKESGRLAANAGDYKRALQFFQRVSSKLEPDVLVLVGACRLKLGRYQDALDSGSRYKDNIDGPSDAGVRQQSELCIAESRRGLEQVLAPPTVTPPSTVAAPHVEPQQQIGDATPQQPTTTTQPASPPLALSVPEQVQHVPPTPGSNSSPPPSGPQRSQPEIPAQRPATPQFYPTAQQIPTVPMWANWPRAVPRQ